MKSRTGIFLSFVALFSFLFLIACTASVGKAVAQAKPLAISDTFTPNIDGNEYTILLDYIQTTIELEKIGSTALAAPQAQVQPSFGKELSFEVPYAKAGDTVDLSAGLPKDVYLKEGEKLTFKLPNGKSYAINAQKVYNPPGSALKASVTFAVTASDGKVVFPDTQIKEGEEFKKFDKIIDGYIVRVFVIDFGIINAAKIGIQYVPQVNMDAGQTFSQEISGSATIQFVLEKEVYELKIVGFSFLEYENENGLSLVVFKKGNKVAGKDILEEKPTTLALDGGKTIFVTFASIPPQAGAYDLKFTLSAKQPQEKPAEPILTGENLKAALQPLLPAPIDALKLEGNKVTVTFVNNKATALLNYKTGSTLGATIGGSKVSFKVKKITHEAYVKVTDNEGNVVVEQAIAQSSSIFIGTKSNALKAIAVTQKNAQLQLVTPTKKTSKSAAQKTKTGAYK